MELFLPGIIVLLLASFFAFLVVPRLGTMILVITSVISLILAGTHHYYMFSSEYTLSTWQNALTAYTPWVMIFLSLLFLIGAMQYIFTGSKDVLNSVITPAEKLGNSLATSVANMPPSRTATNSITGAINSGIRTISNSPIIPQVGYKASEF